MLIPKEVFHVSKLCDTESTRYAMCGVRLERDAQGPVAVGCNGRSMLAVRWTEAEASEFPVGSADRAHVEGFATLIPAKAWSSAAKALPKQKPSIRKPILDNVLLDEPNANGTVRLVTGNVDGLPSERSEKAAGGMYPKWRDVIPSEDRKTSVAISVNPAILAEALTTMSKMGIENVTMHFAGAEDCIKLTGEVTNDDGHSLSVVGAVMPLASDR